VFELMYGQVGMLIKDGYTNFIFGSWGDFDTTARIAVISHKHQNPKVKTVYYQASHTGDTERLLQKYDEVIPPIQDRQQNAHVYRDQYIVAQSDYCIFYVTNKTGDARKAMDYAIAQNKPFINLADL